MVIRLRKRNPPSKKASPPSEDDKIQSEETESNAESEDDQDDEEYDIDYIISERKRKNRVEYFVKWTGYEDQDNSWVLESDVSQDARERWQREKLKPPEKRKKPSTDAASVGKAKKKLRLNEDACPVCNDEGGLGRVCANCKRKMHHFCGTAVCVELKLTDKDGNPLLEFPDGVCYCSFDCYSGKAPKETIAPIEVIVSKKAKPNAGDTVAFCPDNEDWMPKTLYKDVGSSYIVGVANCMGKKSKKKDPQSVLDMMYEVRWWDTRFQSSKHVHIVSEKKIREGIEHYKRLNNTMMRGETWRALCKLYHSDGAVIQDDVNDLEEVSDEYVRYSSKASIPQCIEEVESLEGMVFASDASLKEPNDLFAHPDGSTGAKLKEEFRELFEHSASSSFFAYLPLSFWRKVVEHTNADVEHLKEKAVTLEELMTWLGIMFYMAVVRKGEYANYWGSQVEERIFGSMHSDMSEKMAFRRFKFIRKALCFRSEAIDLDLKKNMIEAPAGRIRPLINILKLRSTLFVDVGRNVCVDESSIACRSKYARHLIVFNATIPTGKYHFKIYVCCCSSSWLAIGFKLHCSTGMGVRLGGLLDRDKTVQMQKATLYAKEVRKHVIETTIPVHFSNRIVNTDNFYTSCQLLQSLKVFGLYGRGTIRANSLHFPRCIRIEKKDEWERGSMKQAVEVDNKLVAASWVDGNIVNIVSNTDGSDVSTVTRRIKQTTVQIQAPKCISEYNQGMQGVDRLDQLRGRFSLADGHSFKKWHKKLALAFIDIARCNAYVTRKLAIGDKGDKTRDSHKIFVEDLAHQLISGEWKNSLGDDGMMYDSPSTEVERIPRSPSASQLTSPAAVHCQGQKSLQADEVSSKSRAKRQCVICRFEMRYPTEDTLYCGTHKVCLCGKKYPMQHSSAPFFCPNVDWTCWKKFHEWYLPKGLFSANGNIKRSCQINKDKTAHFEPPSVLEEPSLDDVVQIANV